VVSPSVVGFRAKREGARWFGVAGDDMTMGLPGRKGSIESLDLGVLP
jgi:hypothetical protein